MLAVMATTLLGAGCGAYEDPGATTEPDPSDLDALRPDLEKVMHHLEQLDERGLPRTGEGESPVVFQSSSSSSWDRIFVAIADGGEVVPPVNSRATALVALILNPASGDALVALEHNVPRVIAAQIRFSPGGLNGDRVVTLDPRPSFTINRARLSAEDVSNLRAGRLYVNITSQAHRAGEVRGQLLRLGETLYTALMSSGEEVQDPRPVSGATGSLAVILNRDRDQIRGEGAFFNLTTPSTVAHIHQAPLGVNGPIRFPLMIVPAATRSGNLVLGPTGVSDEDVVLLDTAGFYSNVHSQRFPLGEIRAQLIRK